MRKYEIPAMGYRRAVIARGDCRHSQLDEIRRLMWTYVGIVLRQRLIRAEKKRIKNLQEELKNITGLFILPPTRRA